ncbi:MAG: gliding motility-associated-like protein, partial [Saprospiraceae bacterium]
YDLDCESLTLISNNTTDNDTLEYNWDMGDGFEFDTYDVNHIYDTAGDFTVTLTATDVFCNVSEEVVVDIIVEPTVVTSIDGGGIQACDSIDAVFINSTLNATDYFWDFGDGTSSTEAEPTHTFIGPATYEVILTATNPDACNIQDQDTIIVSVGANQTLLPLYDLVQTDCLNFTVETTNQSVGLNIQYTWDMGDGTILNGFNISHSYDAVGTYDVTLLMTDTLCNISEELTQTINISGEVIALIPNGDQLICAPTELFFETNGIGTATWDFGDAPGVNPVMGDEVSHVYDIPGSYIVTLTVTGDGACPGLDEDSIIVEVIAPPILTPNFTYTPVGECIDMSFEFTNNSDGLIDNFYWQFGDGNVSNEENPDHDYDLSEIFEVILTIENSVCDIQEEISLIVIPDQQLDYELNDTWLCPETDQITLDAAISGATYSWSNGESTQEIQISDPGEYQVVIIENGCSYSDIINVSYIQPLNLDQVVTQCETNDETNTILIPYEDAESYLWQNEIEGQFLEITSSGLFDFTIVDNYGCQQSGVIDATIIPRDANIFIPNSFTPNEDGLNDLFRPITSDLEEYELTIYDRWGEEIFYSRDVTQSWNGGVQGGESYYVPDGIYSYSILYRSICSTEKILKYGFVTIVR